MVMVRVDIRHAGQRSSPVFRVPVLLVSVMALGVFMMPTVLGPGIGPEQLG